MTETKDVKARILATADKLGLTMSAEFVPWSKSRNAGEKLPSLNWKVTLSKDGKPVLTTDYMAGSGHCPSYKQMDKSIDHNDLIRWECENGRCMKTNAKPILPDLADVLHSLASDADAIDHATYEEWGLEIALKLRAALGEDGLKELREAVQDY